MKKYVCINDRVFFNKKIYNYGDELNIDESLEAELNKCWFEPKEDFDRKREVVVKKVTIAQKNGRTVKEVIEESEAEKTKIKKEYEAKIEKLEKQLNPKVKNDL